jgi:signal transduction histidine kinase
MRSESADAGTPSTVALPSATLADVDIRTELAARPTRPPNYAREHLAFGLLTAEMAENPRNMLQKLVQVAVELCEAHTAGISLLDGDVFRWEAVAGVFASARGRTMPRSASPCGVCIDRDATQLMHLADRCFPALFAEPRFVEALLIPFHDHGRPVGTVWIVSHTIDRKFDREDERIVRVLSQFASAAWQLWKTTESLAESSRRKDDFLATLGHELRNPFAAIAAAASILQQCVTDDERATRAVNVVARQSLHVSRLLDDLLDIARINSGKLLLETRRVDLRTVVEEAIETSRPKIERRRQSITMELGADPILLEADPVRLAQVVSNLVDNAVKYTPENGNIFVAVSAEGSEAMVAVRDTGIGVPADRAQSIFQPFTQLGDASDMSAGGLGLGLALVRSLTELHGGAVQVVSAGPGEGSCFTVRLPLHSKLRRVEAAAPS